MASFRTNKFSEAIVKSVFLRRGFEVAVLTSPNKLSEERDTV